MRRGGPEEDARTSISPAEAHVTEQRNTGKPCAISPTAAGEKQASMVEGHHKAAIEQEEVKGRMVAEQRNEALYQHASLHIRHSPKTLTAVRAASPGPRAGAR